MKLVKNSASFTAISHCILKHKIQAILWDIISQLKSEEEILSVKDVLNYIRLFSDYGDKVQGNLFLQCIKDYQCLTMILPSIAEKFINQGKVKGFSWLEELGTIIVSKQSLENIPLEKQHSSPTPIVPQ